MRLPDDAPPTNPVNVWTTILTDVHFWVPALVLLAGLVVLHWIR